MTENSKQRATRDAQGTTVKPLGDSYGTSEPVDSEDDSYGTSEPVTKPTNKPSVKPLGDSYGTSQPADTTQK
ncbi:hypothetical protein E1265_21900 [Streptomyces sp. 8K308]|uniref:hypothetical protein n=1 Tax=Streptomyces sp. 8K308 TaxID=2530388 RepID=UPI0010461D25|nr:hypothetical protein [Streptomyces sp. 8K308]TDC20515.1 hypothetical protein E1265_21900 [Streptomyces sp. 8K308]